MIAVCFGACGPSVDSPVDPASGDTGTGTAESTGESGDGPVVGTTGADEGDTVGGSSTTDGPGIPCDGSVCAPGQLCDWTQGTCDGSGLRPADRGQCADPPVGCDDFYNPVCGCDGQVYGNACEAASAGVDTDASGACLPPRGLFPCGDEFCDVATSFCFTSISDSTLSPSDYSCQPLPEACAGAPSCDCVAADDLCVIPNCEADDGNVTISC